MSNSTDLYTSWLDDMNVTTQSLTALTTLDNNTAADAVASTVSVSSIVSTTTAVISDVVNSTVSGDTSTVTDVGDLDSTTSATSDGFQQSTTSKILQTITSSMYNETNNTSSTTTSTYLSTTSSVIRDSTTESTSTAATSLKTGATKITEMISTTQQLAGSTQATAAETDPYRAPFIAMTIIAILLLLAIIAVCYLLWKRRGHVEIKSISIKTRKRANHQTKDLNGKDVEASHDQVELVKANKSTERNGEETNGLDNPTYNTAD